MHSREEPPLVVIDTNVLLDWLVFRHPACNPLETALAAGRVRWVACRSMHDEMAHVLQRGLDPRWTVDDARWRAAWVQHVHWHEPAATAGGWPRCTDADDQKFIDLAIAASARWLLTRDRALLKLARRAQRHGVAVLTPERWNATAADRPPSA